MTSEDSVEDYLVHVVERRLGGMCVKLNPAWRRYIPDRLCVLPGGRCWFVELKRPTNSRTTEGQRRMHIRLAKGLGQDYARLYSRAEVDAWYKRRLGDPYHD